MEFQFDTEAFRDYLTDEDKEAISGVWVPLSNTVEFRIKRAGGYNKAYNRMVQSLGKPHKRRIQMGTLDEKAANDMIVEAYAKTVVMDWSGVTVGGKEIPYSPEACQALFRAVPEVFQQVVDFAESINTFQSAELEEAQEELGNSSDGSASTAST